MKITVLGSGTSQGIPIVGCECKTCTSDNPKDKRLRVSVYIETERQKILIDTSSDFRQQMLLNNVTDIDTVLYTHAHIDHISGLDDIRQINQLHRKYVDVYGNEETIQNIKQTFRYIFNNDTYKGGGIPRIKTHVIANDKFLVKGVEIIPIEYFHGPAIVFGYRIENFAYLTDCSKIPPKEFPKLENLEVLIIDALRYKPHPTHLSINEAIEISQKLNPQMTYFTHITHDVLHDEANSMLPESIQLSYDGLVIEI